VYFTLYNYLSSKISGGLCFSPRLPDKLDGLVELDVVDDDNDNDLSSASLSLRKTLVLLLVDPSVPVLNVVFAVENDLVLVIDLVRGFIIKRRRGCLRSMESACSGRRVIARMNPTVFGQTEIPTLRISSFLLIKLSGGF